MTLIGISLTGTPPTKLRRVLEKLRNKLDGARAILFVGPNGVVDQLIADPGVDVDAIVGEYAMLLRIATRTSEDTGAGNLVEHVVVSDRSMVIARNISPDNFLIVLFRTNDQIGRARYELKQAAWELTRGSDAR
jgi:predicted regulator of Ras-like GTPase activity (Roadblock/LC7/MglB family)